MGKEWCRDFCLTQLKDWSWTKKIVGNKEQQHRGSISNLKS